MSDYQNTVCVTIDIDWAPDFMIDFAADVLIENNIPCTWFCTHATPALDRLRACSDLFELGIHPNFLPGSSHGNSMEKVLDHCLEIVPEAVSSRSHAVVQSGRLLGHLATHTPITHECSTFLPDMAGVYPLRHHLPAGALTRVPFVWADDYHLCKSNPDWVAAPLLQPPGLKVLTFHPVHIYLNSPTLAFYDDTRPVMATGDAGQIESSVFQGQGVRDIFSDLCQTLAAADSAHTAGRIATLRA